MTTTLSLSEARCSVCERDARCLLVTIADDLGDMRRSALTLRTMTATICFGCVDRERVKREPGKRHLWHDPGDGVAAVVRAACEGER